MVQMDGEVHLDNLMNVAHEMKDKIHLWNRFRPKKRQRDGKKGTNSKSHWTI